MRTSLAWVAAALLLVACSDDDSNDAATAGNGGAGTGASGATGPGGAGSGGNGGASTGGGGSGASGGSSALGSLGFTVNAQSEHDYGLLTAIPPGFGDGEFTMELWIKPDDSFPVGTTAGGSEQLTNWSDTDSQPYSGGGWWFAGNFLLDGHNNGGFESGTFSLQLYGGGRLRWLFGDGVTAGPGGHWSVGAYPASLTPSLLDGSWHQVTLVRRWSGQTDAALELWIDGSMIDSETSSVRTDMRAWFDAWSSFPGNQAGWFWGAEKQAAVGVLDQYEDYKGLLAELRFWSLAKSASEIMTDYDLAVAGNEPGLVGWFPLNEGSGTSSCDALASTRCIDLIDMKPGYWNTEGPPLR